MANFIINSKAKPRTYAKKTPFPDRLTLRIRSRMNSPPPEIGKKF
jgi:hypothetical protein